MRDLGLEERFRRFPNGLLTEVDERGTRLSAGERQLISLVRIALANPEVAILDEALSNVDPGTEALVQRTMRRLMEGRTVIVIAHRETTAQRADRVAFLEHGSWRLRAATTNCCALFPPTPDFGAKEVITTCSDRYGSAR